MAHCVYSILRSPYIHLFSCYTQVYVYVAGQNVFQVKMISPNEEYIDFSFFLILPVFME